MPNNSNTFNMKIWKRQWKLFSLGILLFFPFKLEPYCGPYGALQFEGYSFTRPDLLNPLQPGAPYFPDFETIYQQFGIQDRIQPRDNIGEWHERFCEIPREKDIAEIIYATNLRELQYLRTIILSPSVGIPRRWSNNSFVRHLKRNDCREAIDYLLFAKRCEPYVTRPLDPWQDNQRDKYQMRELIRLGLQYFDLAESHYFKLRYAYQVIRLSHYAKDYQRTLELHDFLVPKLDNDPSIIEYWIMGHRAGALLALGQRTEAAYLYSLIFSNCPSKQESAYRSFQIQSDEEWDAVLKKCRDDQERAALYALRAHHEESRAAEEMAVIFDIDPKSSWLPVLLIQEIKKLEKDFLGLGFNDHARQNERYFDIPRDEASEYLIDLWDLVRRINLAGTAQYPGLWVAAEGYLALLAGDYYYAQRALDAALESAQSKPLKEQLKAWQLVLDIASIQSIDNQTAEQLAAIRYDNATFNEYPYFQDFFNDKLSTLYDEDEHPGLAFMLQYDLETLRKSPEDALVQDLINITQARPGNRMERNILRVSTGESLREALLDLKGTNLMREGRIAPALQVFKQMDRAIWDDFGVFNPFIQNTSDCVHCLPGDSLTYYSRGAIIERLLELEVKARAFPDEADQHLYQLGLAYYNMSYFGYAWNAMDHFRSGASLTRVRRLNEPSNIVPAPGFPNGNPEHFDCTTAQIYFESAMQVTTNPELGAAAAYMAAKCERNNNYWQNQPRTNQFLEILRTNYADTEMFDRVIKECKYFRTFATR